MSSVVVGQRASIFLALALRWKSTESLLRSVLAIGTLEGRSRDVVLER